MSGYSRLTAVFTAACALLSTALCAQTVLPTTTPGVVNGPGRVRATTGPSATIVRVLAGLDSTGADSVRLRHRQWMNRSWAAFSSQRRLPIRQWGRRHLPSVAAAQPVLYPFGGVDLPSALAMYPNQSRYVLIGLEPVGALPEWERLTPDSLNQYLTGIRDASRTLLAVGFLRTNDMATALERIGATPVLLALLGREGASVVDVAFGSVGADGAFLMSRRAAKSAGDVVRIRFRLPGDTADRMLDYLSMDLSDGGLRQPGLRPFLASLSDAACLTKAATYLMHKPYFGTVRQQLLRQCAVLVQDDSGIPLRYLREAGHAVTIHGAYSEPIPMFKEWVQPELREAAQGAKALPFGWGYRWKAAESTVMVVVRAERRRTA